MARTIPVAHDFICPWCWVGLLQAKKLHEEFGVNFDWQGYELFPEELAWPEWKAGPEQPNRPPTPSRFDFILAADNIAMPTAERPKGMRTHNAHEAVEFVKSKGDHEAFLEALYRAYWEEGKEINSIPVILEVAKPFVESTVELEAAIQERKFKDKIVGFDDEAYGLGIYNVPTFFLDDKRLAEQPYVFLEKAFKEALAVA